MVYFNILFHRILRPREHRRPRRRTEATIASRIRGHIHNNGPDGNGYAQGHLFTTRFDGRSLPIFHVLAFERLSLHSFVEHYSQRFEAKESAS